MLIMSQLSVRTPLLIKNENFVFYFATSTIADYLPINEIDKLILFILTLKYLMQD